MFAYHIKRSDNLEKNIIEYIKLANFNDIKPAIQIFVRGPRNSKIILSDEDAYFISLLPIPCVIHGAYVDIPWSKNKTSLNNIQEELNISDEINALGVIIHLSKLTMQNYDIIKNLKSNSVLWLEINVSKSNIFADPLVLNDLFSKINNIMVYGQKIGLCIDTAHLYASGVSFETKKMVKEWMSKINIPLLMFHLNDTDSELNSGIDHHLSLKTGNIWKNCDSGLRYIINYIKQNNLLCVLERDVIDDNELKIIRSYYI